MKNLRRAERLLEDIHTMKDLKPDYVSKTALQRNLNYEEVCEKPSSTTEERAIARIASHPLVCKKIAAIKAAVSSFKEAREKDKDQKLLQEPQLKTESLQVSSPEEMSHSKTNKIKADNTMGERSKSTHIKQASAALDKSEPEALIDKCFNNEDTSKVQAAESALVSHVTKQIRSKATHIEETSAALDKPEPEALNEKCFSDEDTSKAQAAELALVSQVTEKTRPAQLNTQKKLQVSMNSENTKPIDEDESVEEKEYFDDSTEERFYNQTSSDESGDDDFFIGKVKRTNKKKQESDPTSDVNTVNDDEKNVPTSMKEGKSDPIGKKNREQTKFGSLFCNNLSSSKPSMQKSNLRGVIKNKKSAVLQKSPNTKKLSLRERSQGGPGKVIPKPQQSLHPSWEASRRRKEQIQIVAFQGKKIRFDD
ncbi:serum response factor-binding protein 1 isoform X2 [Pristis pectinata]|nr:serum response factor-binding protein 1 isoform X2 [Pristis pectinata]